VTPEPGVGRPESTEAERGGLDGRLVLIEGEHDSQSTPPAPFGYAAMKVPCRDDALASLSDRGPATIVGVLDQL